MSSHLKPLLTQPYLHKTYHNTTNNTYIFYSAIPRWASSTRLFTYMYIIYTIYIYYHIIYKQSHNTYLINETNIKQVQYAREMNK